MPLAMNGSGIRDISRVLRVSINTVLKTIRRQAEGISEPVVPSRVTELQIDEMWSFVGKKANQRWLWYGFDPDRKTIVSYELGRRTDESCNGLSPFFGPSIMR